MKKRKLKRALRSYKKECALFSDALEKAEENLRIALATPPSPAEIELLIAARVELADLKSAEGCRRNVATARKQERMYLLEGIKMRMQEPGTQEYWKEFQEWARAWNFSK